MEGCPGKSTGAAHSLPLLRDGPPASQARTPLLRPCDLASISGGKPGLELPASFPHSAPIFPQELCTCVASSAATRRWPLGSAEAAVPESRGVSKSHSQRPPAACFCRGAATGSHGLPPFLFGSARRLLSWLHSDFSTLPSVFWLFFSFPQALSHRLSLSPFPDLCRQWSGSDSKASVPRSRVQREALDARLPPPGPIHLVWP